MAIGYHAKLPLQISHGVAQVEVEVTVEVLNFIAERGELALERDALLTRGLEIVDWPRSPEWRIAAQPAGKLGDRESISVRIVESLERDEVVGDEKCRPSGAAGKKQDRVAVFGQCSAVGAAYATRAPLGIRAGLSRSSKPCGTATSKPQRRRGCQSDLRR
jgi:hypothetical protein